MSSQSNGSGESKSHTYTLDTKYGDVQMSLRCKVNFVKGEERLIMRDYDGYARDPADPIGVEKRFQQIIWERRVGPSHVEIDQGIAVHIEWEHIWIAAAMAVQNQLEMGRTITRIPLEVVRYIPAERLTPTVETYSALDKYGYRGVKTDI